MIQENYQKLRKKALFLLLALTLLCVPVQRVSAEQALTDTTKTLVWNQSYSGLARGTSTDNKFTFSLAQSGHIGFVFNVKNTSSIGGGMAIYDSANNLVYSCRLGNGTGTFSVDLLAGDYTMIITAGLWNDCDFSFVASFTPSGETRNEHYLSKNNEVGMAAPYTVGTTYVGQFAINDEIDMYVLNLPQNGIFELNVNSQIASYSFALVNSYGDIYLESGEISSGKHKYTYSLPKGTYYITFTSYTSKYLDSSYSFNTSLSSIPKTKIKKVKNIKPNSMKVTWSRNSKVNGYQVQISTNKKFKKGRKSFTIGSASSSNTKINTLKKNKTYYVRIRTYITAANGKTYYSAWSGAKKVKIAK